MCSVHVGHSTGHILDWDSALRHRPVFNHPDYIEKRLLTARKCLAASSQICIPLDSFTSIDPKYCKENRKNIIHQLSLQTNIDFIIR